MLRLPRGSWFALAALAVSAAACATFDAGPATTEPSPTGPDTSSSGAGSAACTPSCDGAERVLCEADGSARRERCSGTCTLRDDAPECAPFDPYGPVRADELEPNAALAPLSLFSDAAGTSFELNPRTGEILLVEAAQAGSEPIRTPLRQPNQDPSHEEILGGVGFRLEEGRAIFRAERIQLGGEVQLAALGADSMAGTGTLPAVTFVAIETISIQSKMRWPCAQAGGRSQDGAHGQNIEWDTIVLPSGGGHAAAGGHGAARSATAAGQPGGEPIGFSPSALRAGGAGGGVLEAVGGGGGGGGGLQLVAGLEIVVGQPGASEDSVSSGINVGGCGGRESYSSFTGAAGGAGGTLVIEAPKLTAHPGSALVANGGAGGGRALDGADAPGEDGGWERAPARPAWPRRDDSEPSPERTCDGCGGFGATAQLAGGAGVWLSAASRTGWTAGGGAAGFVVLRTGEASRLTAAKLSPEPLLRSLTD